MMSNIHHNEAGTRDAGANLSGQQQAQPVVSLLEKYSSLHRGIDQARKVYSQRQLEIESVEEEIYRLVEIDRIENHKAIQAAISEKKALLQTLETLTLNDLVEAQEAEFLARSNRESVRFREERAKRIQQDDYNEFLNTSKAFREKIRTLCLRGELFGLKSPVALLSVYKTLHGSSPTTRTTNTKGQKNDEKGEAFSNEIENLQFIDASLLWGDETVGTAEGESDEEMQDLLKQIQSQNELNEKHQAILEQKKEKYRCLLDAKQKREKQKKDLESQWERLRKDVRSVALQIESLNEQTREAIELTERFRNEVNSPPGGGTKTVNTTNNNHRTNSKRKLATPYNPYARANRRKPCTSADNSESTNATAARIISPATETANRNSQSAGDNQRAQQSLSPAMSSIKSRRQNQARSKRGRSSRRFGETSFRAPSESMMRVASGNKNSGRSGFSTRTEAISKSVKEKSEQKQSASSPLYDLEDTDEDDDDLSWLNATPSLSSSNRYQS